ncbi:hypothetical protein [Runella sp.]|uniref:hypothetical protein n=1 Tax=Runella sp. TaxID=1960881 RepID=UPI003D148243
MKYPRTIDQSAALRRLHQNVNKLNEAMPVKTFQRTQKSGSVKTIVYRPKRINASTKATAEHLVKAYVRQFYKTINAIGDAAFTDGLPSLETNGVQIAAWRSFSDRTSRNHLATLRDANIVSEYKFHGSEADFEVWINPEILFDFAQLEVEKSQISAITGTVLDHLDKNFPHKVTVTHSNLDIEIDKASKQHGDIQKTEGLLVEQGNNHGNTEQQQPDEGKTDTLGALPCHSDNQPGGAPAGRKRQRYERTDAQKQAIFDGFLNSFWLYAKQILYPSRNYQPWQDEQALRTIRRSVYNHFETELTEKEWDNYQKELYQRLEMVSRYYAKHPDKYIPEPYAWGKEGAGYFDWENERGFRATEQWLRNSQQMYRIHYTRQVVSRAIRSLQKHRAGTAPVKLQKLSYLEAYRTIERSLERYGETVLDRFKTLAITVGQDKPVVFQRGFTKVIKRTN